MKNSKVNSKSKYKKFKVSPLIPIIAIIEVIILVSVCTFAWFTAASHKTVLSDVITVDPDSGLEIDFNNPTDDSININDYLNDFKFEPATSVDGRNIFFPTLGTFGETSTDDMEFREGTVNDINSKYLCIDFTLTNTNKTEDIPVYLSSESYFKVKGTKEAQSNDSSSALRFAFYQNDGSAGRVTSNLLHSYTDQITVYFYNNVGWENVYAYCWQGSTEIEKYPGVPAKHISDNLYYFTFSSTTYTSIIFNDGNDNTGQSSPDNIHQTGDINLNGDGTKDNYQLLNGYIYSVPSGNINYFKASNGTYKYEITTTPYFNDYNTGTYPVISPGTSTGFQRGYSPIVDIDNDTGAPTTIIPAFAGAFDDYLYKTSDTTGEKALFSLKAGETSSLSMIVWLEGTDPACDKNGYAGKFIDIYFKFATKSKGADSLYTYKFLDRTLNAWTSDKITDNGITFNTVMQMCDLTTGKGYLMSPSQTYTIYNDDNTSTQKTVDWSCEAPQSIVNDPEGAHDIVFRRVCPTDEHLYWNYWEAGKVVNQFGSQTTDTITFTALADSCPSNSDSREKFPQNLSYACGGLWGSFDTNPGSANNTYNLHKFCVYDADGNALGASAVADTGAAISVKYTYGNRAIEYKMDGPYNGGFYYCNIPENCLNSSTSTNITIKKYSGFKTGALTSAVENPYLQFDDIKKSDNNPLGGNITGWFYNVGGSSDSNHDNCYFGNDIIYLEVNSTVNKSDDFYQVEYFTAGGDGGSYYNYLYDKGEYHGITGFNGYVSIVPVTYGMYITNFTYERCNNGDHSKINHRSPSNSPSGEGSDTSPYYANLAHSSTTVGGTQYYYNFLKDNYKSDQGNETRSLYTMNFYYKTLYFRMSTENYDLEHTSQNYLAAISDNNFTPSTYNDWSENDRVRDYDGYPPMREITKSGGDTYFRVMFNERYKYMYWQRAYENGADYSQRLSTAVANGTVWCYNKWTCDEHGEHPYEDKFVLDDKNKGSIDSNFDAARDIGYQNHSASRQRDGKYIAKDSSWLSYTYRVSNS